MFIVNITQIKKNKNKIFGRAIVQLAYPNLDIGYSFNQIQCITLYLFFFFFYIYIYIINGRFKYKFSLLKNEKILSSYRALNS